MFKRILMALAAMLLLLGVAHAQESKLTPEEQAQLDKLLKIRDSLNPQTGVINLPSAKARLNLGQGYYFLDAEDTRKVLVDGWGNSPDAADGVLGMVFPAGTTFLDDTWGAIVTYEKTGYVTDEDAKTADYDQLLKDMRAGEAAGNEERRKQGYVPIHLAGWAQAPSYDAARHDLIWARELVFGDETDHTLNYDVRHLGREGVLSLNMVSNMSKIEEVRSAALELARTADFQTGARYADYEKGDELAGFGLAGLVGAGAGLAVAKKAGLLAIILAFAKKGIVFVLAGGAAAYAWIRKKLSAKDKDLDLGSPVALEPAPESAEAVANPPDEPEAQRQPRPAET